MSMLAAQCDELREKARLLRLHADGLSAPYIVPSTKELMALTMLDAAGRMEDAADSIESLRDRLQADVPGLTATADEKETWEYVCDSMGRYGERMTLHEMECGSCGRTFEHVNGMYPYCPHCRCAFGKEGE